MGFRKAKRDKKEEKKCGVGEILSGERGFGLGVVGDYVVSMYAGGFFAGFSGYLGKMGRMGSDGIGLCCVVVCFCTLA